MPKKKWWLVKQKRGGFKPEHMTFKQMEAIPPKNVYRMYHESESIALIVLKYKKKHGGTK